MAAALEDSSEYIWRHEHPVNTPNMTVQEYRRAFVSTPVHKAAGTVRCYVKVERQASIPCFCAGVKKTFTMYLQTDPRNNGDECSLPKRKPGQGVLTSRDSLDIPLLTATRKGMVPPMSLKVKLADSQFASTVGKLKCGQTRRPSYRLSLNNTTSKEKSTIDAGLVSIMPQENYFTANVILPKIQEEPRPYLNLIDDSAVNMHMILPSTMSFRASKKRVVPQSMSVHPRLKEFDSSWTIQSTGQEEKTVQEWDEILLGAEQGLGVPDSLFLSSSVQPSLRSSVEKPFIDFSGRVTMASCKNFQFLLRDQAELSSDTLSSSAQSQFFLEFGKVDDWYENGRQYKLYTLDFEWPLSPFQAFGIFVGTSLCEEVS